jgi:Xaa-Pro aminopeptidase
VRQAIGELAFTKEALASARGVADDQLGLIGARKSPAEIALAEEAVRRAEAALAEARQEKQAAHKRATAAAELLNNCERAAREGVSD